MELGEIDANKVIELGEGVSYENLLHYHHLMKKGDERVKQLSL